MSGITQENIVAFLDTKGWKASVPLRAIDYKEYYNHALLHGVALPVANFGLFDKSVLPQSFVEILEASTEPENPETPENPEDPETPPEGQEEKSAPKTTKAKAK